MFVGKWILLQICVMRRVRRPDGVELDRLTGDRRLSQHRFLIGPLDAVESLDIPADD